MNRRSSTVRTGLWPMGEPPRRARGRAAARTALAVLAVLVGASACADRPVSPLPVRPPTPAASTVGAASPTAASPTPERPTATPPRRSPTPPRSRTARPTPLPSACLGAVRYDLVLAETELALLKSLCFATGGVLRIRGIGPGLVTVDRADLVSRSYEAGVVDIRFVRAGTVVVTIPQDGRTYPITVVVV